MRTLLILMAIASLSVVSLGNAGEEWQNNPQPARMTDARMKALLIGTWNPGGGGTYTFTAHGKWLVTDPEFPDEPNHETYRWDIKDGVLIQIRLGLAASRPYTIVFLTRHECLLFAGHHEQGYFFWWR